MHARLQPLWDAVKDPFPLDKAKTHNGGSNISVGKLDAIKSMSADGKTPQEIAKILGVSTMTVYLRRKEKV